MITDPAELLQNHEERISALEKLLKSPSVSLSAQKRQSAKEFLMTKSPRTETQKVLALAYYLEHFDGLASFNVPDLEVVFRSARERLPKNLNDAVNKNIARGFVMEAAEKKDAKKAWQLTASGECFVEQDMGKA